MLQMHMDSLEVGGFGGHAGMVLADIQFGRGIGQHGGGSQSRAGGKQGDLSHGISSSG
jgi:hypothetical protein